VSSRGDQRDIKVRKLLEGLGFLVGSRRKIPGAGDLVALRQRSLFAEHEVLLVEVKSTAQGPWERFGRTERLALAELASEHGATGCVAWWPPRGALRWYVVHGGDPGILWSGPGTMAATLYDPSPSPAQRPSRSGPVPPPADGPRVV
jgi:hypothetical protein